MQLSSLNDTTSAAASVPSQARFVIGMPGRVAFVVALATPLVFSLDYGPMPKVNSQVLTVLLWSLWLITMRLQGVRSMPTSATVAFIALLVVIGIQALLGMFGYWSRVMLSSWQIALAAFITSLSFDPRDHDEPARGSFLSLFGWGLLIVVFWQIPVTVMQFFHFEPWLYAQSPTAGRLLTYGLWLLPLLYFLPRIASKTMRWQFTLYWGLGGVLFVLAWLAFLRFIEGSGRDFFYEWLVSPGNPGDAMSNVRQRNQLASLAALGYVGLVFLYPRFKVWQHWLIVVLVTLPLALSNSRTGTVHVFLLPLLWFFLMGRAGLAKRWWPVLAVPVIYLAWSAVISVLASWLLHDVDNIFRRLYQVGTSLRWHNWPQVYQVFTTNPLLGVGWGQLRVGMLDTNFHLAGAGANDVLEYIDHAHNLVLEFLAETGLLGFFVMLAAALVWLRHIWQLRARGDYVRHPWAAAALYGALVFLAHSMLEFPLWYCYFLFPVCLLMTLSVASDPAPERWRVNSRYLTVFACLSVVLSIWVFIAYQQARQLYYPAPGKTATTQQEAIEKVRNGPWFPELGDFIYVLTNPLDGKDIERRYLFNEKVLTAFTDPRVLTQQIAIACYMGGKRLEVLRRARYIRTAFTQGVPTAVQDLWGYLEAPDPTMHECIKAAIDQIVRPEELERLKEALKLPPLDAPSQGSSQP